MSFVKKVCCLVILCFLAISTFAQNVAYVNGKPINTKEFIWVFKKNNTGYNEQTLQNLENYLKLYINFKLKVAEAKALGLDTNTAYKQEIINYERTLKTQKRTSTKYKAFDYILNEYREGVLMFNLSEKEIWSKLEEKEIINFYQKNAPVYQNKNFEDIRSQVISDYQNFLETQWIKVLKTKYTVKVNEDELKKLIKP